MSTLQELIEQRDALTAQIREAQRKERAENLVTMREWIAEFGFLPTELFGSKQKGIKLPALYYDADTGNTWSGRGKAPRWMNGRNPAEFLIDKPGILGQMEMV